MYRDEHSASMFAEDLIKIILANPSTTIQPCKEGAENLAEFYHTLVEELTNKD